MFKQYEQDMERIGRNSGFILDLILIDASNITMMTRQKKSAGERAFIMGKPDTANPYNTSWFKRVLKDHFDVDLEQTKAPDQHAGVKWKVRRINQNRKSPGTKGSPVNYGPDEAHSQEIEHMPTSHQGPRKIELKVGKSPAMNNFVHKVPFFLI